MPIYRAHIGTRLHSSKVVHMRAAQPHFDGLRRHTPHWLAADAGKVEVPMVLGDQEVTLPFSLCGADERYLYTVTALRDASVARRFRRAMEMGPRQVGDEFYLPVFLRLEPSKNLDTQATAQVLVYQLPGVTITNWDRQTTVQALYASRLGTWRKFAPTAHSHD